MKRVGQLDQFPPFRKPTIKSRAEGGNYPLVAPLLEDAGISPRQQEIPDCANYQYFSQPTECMLPRVLYEDILIPNRVLQRKALQSP